MPLRACFFFVLGISLLGNVFAQSETLDSPIAGRHIACIDGSAIGFPCSNVDLLARMTMTQLQGTRLSDIWGWTDPETGREYALVARTDGTSFVDVTDPLNPEMLGNLPAPPDTKFRVWRDLKVYNNHVYIVADGAGPHGMQVYDLTHLREPDTLSTTLAPIAHYDAFDSAHNIAINEQTGYAYVIGASSGGETCGGGLHMIDLADPANPQFAGCFADPTTGRRGTGYTHDVQCVIYRGPDAQYHGRELCFGSNETAIHIADVTNKTNPVTIAVASYPDYGYIHQGWLTEDHRYFLQDDETDEIQAKVARTRTLIWDVQDLDDPQLLPAYHGLSGATDHNLYIRGNYVYQANNGAGLRILDIQNIHIPREVAYFDTYPQNDDPGYFGAWSSYPFFESGTIVVSSREDGLFILKSTLPTQPDPVATENAPLPSAYTLTAPYPNPFSAQTSFSVELSESQTVTIDVYDATGRHAQHIYTGTLLPNTPQHFAIDGTSLPSGWYLLRVQSPMFQISRRVVLVR